MIYEREEQLLRIEYDGEYYYYIAEHKPSNSRIFTHDILDATYARNIKSNTLVDLKGKSYIISTRYKGVVTDVDSKAIDDTLALVKVIKSIDIEDEL